MDQRKGQLKMKLNKKIDIGGNMQSVDLRVLACTSWATGSCILSFLSELAVLLLLYAIRLSIGSAPWPVSNDVVRTLGVA